MLENQRDDITGKITITVQNWDTLDYEKPHGSWTSSPFELCGHRWQLMLCPNGHSDECWDRWQGQIRAKHPNLALSETEPNAAQKDSIGIYLRALGTARWAKHDMTCTSAHAPRRSLLQPKEKPPFKYFAPGDAFGSMALTAAKSGAGSIPLLQALCAKGHNSFQFNLSLTVRSSANASSKATRPQPKAQCRAHADFGRLLGSGDCSDITFTVGADRTTFKAHTPILSARSPVFRAMFAAGAWAEGAASSSAFKSKAKARGSKTNTGIEKKAAGGKK